MMFAIGLLLFGIGLMVSVFIRNSDDWTTLVNALVVLTGMALMLASAALWLWRVMP